MSHFHPHFILLIFAALLAPLGVHAQLTITEIMYDRDGSDAGKEWIEVHNTSNKAVDLSEWNFYEDETNHRITPLNEGGDTMLPAGAYALIADDGEQIAGEYQSASSVFDSSFSLLNSGEALALRDPNGDIAFSVTYEASWGADGNGNSLQYVNGQWGAGTPTPGAANGELSSGSSGSRTDTSGSSSGESDEQTTTTETADQSEDKSNEESDAGNDTHGTARSNQPVQPLWPQKPQLYARARSNTNVAVVGAPVEFRGQALGRKKTPITEGVEYNWSFGDGAQAQGKKVKHHYTYPGEYAVVLRVASQKYTIRDVITQNVIDADVAVSLASDDAVILTNRTQYRLDLSGWVIETPDTQFLIPEDTMILPGNTVRLSSNVTGVSAPERITLLYPNGSTATTSTPNENKDRSTAPSQEKEASRPKDDVLSSANATSGSLATDTHTHTDVHEMNEDTAGGSSSSRLPTSDPRKKNTTQKQGSDISYRVYTNTTESEKEADVDTTNDNVAHTGSEASSRVKATDATPTHATQTALTAGAAPVAGTDGENTSLFWWGIALVAVAAIGSMAVLMPRRNGEERPETVHAERTGMHDPREFRIIDISEESEKK